MCDSGWFRVASGPCRLAYGLYLQAVWPWRRVVQSPAVMLDRRAGSIRVGPDYLALLHDITPASRSPDQVPVPAVYLLTRLAALAVCGSPPWSINVRNGYRMVVAVPLSFLLVCVRGQVMAQAQLRDWRMGREGLRLVEGGALQHIATTHAMGVGY